MGTGYHRLHVCLLLAICLHYAEHATAAAKCRPQDKSALLSFRNTLVFNPLRFENVCDEYRWDENVDCCAWKGIECHSSAGTVVIVAISGVCFEGTSASFSSKSSLFHLTTLRSLYLDGLNFQRSTIPNEIARLSQLRRLYVGGSNLTGTIPDAVGNLTHLRVLSLSGNDLSGRIPIALSKLKHLETLDLQFCKLTGSIPGALFNIPHLETLQLAFNQLSSLPATVSRRSSLRYLFLSDNKLEGTIPSWLFKIPSLDYIYLQNNRLGPLEPFRKPEVTFLSLVDLSFNKIDGPLPSSLLQLANVSTLNLRATQLTGVVEWNGFKNMVELSSLDLSENRGLTLKNSDGAPINLPKFIELEITSCGFNEFPSFLGKLRSLVYLDVSDNRIGGTAFKESGWEALFFFNGSHNQFIEFEFPKKFFSLMALTSETLFDMSYNLLEGTLPKLPAPPSTPPSRLLDALYLSHNQFSGVIPNEYCKRFVTLDLSYNNFDGLLPSCFNSNENLITLLLQNNRFHGVIPSTLGNGTRLSSLDLSQNRLGGRIPANLVKLESLEYLNLSYNNLQGPIPQGKFPNTSYIGNPGLCGPPLSKQC